ncbi:hypothetical protein [Streptomyces sp. NPDC086838]|uniref:hypothetical protein n=1 Tax=Streptomyces sp. NPDC086838 TaxID=3365762 RepID=UPI00381B1D95
MPANAVARLAIGARDRFRPAATRREEVSAPVRQPAMPLAEIRREAAALLPGCRIRRLLFCRYLLVFRDSA